MTGILTTHQYGGCYVPLEASPVHRKPSEVVFPMVANHQNLLVGGEDKQLRVDYNILSKWSPHILPARASEGEVEEEEEEKVGKEWRRGRREVHVFECVYTNKVTQHTYIPVHVHTAKTVWWF